MSEPVKFNKTRLLSIEQVAADLREFTASCIKNPNDFDKEGNLLPEDAEHIPHYLFQLKRLIEGEES